MEVLGETTGLAFLVRPPSRFMVPPRGWQSEGEGRPPVPPIPLQQPINWKRKRVPEETFQTTAERAVNRPRTLQDSIDTDNSILLYAWYHFFLNL